MAPNPSKLITTGISQLSASCLNSAQASDNKTPCPAKITGFLALARFLAISAIRLGSGSNEDGNMKPYLSGLLYEKPYLSICIAVSQF